jgi:hypothetical protein
MMTKNLTNSQLDRQNILNNPFALQEMSSQIDLKGVVFNDQIWFTTEQVANYFEVTTRTIRNYLENYELELKQNGYKIFTGKDLEIAKSMLGKESSFLTPEMKNIKVSTVLGMFNFRSFLNLGMLLTTGEKSKQLRSLILDTVIGVMNQKLGENRKYINQNDILFEPAKNRYENIYHPKLTVSLKDYTDMGNTKYPYYNDKIYQFLFKEKYKEYRALLNLRSTEKPIDTHYGEVISTIASFETDFAEEIKDKYREINKKLVKQEVEHIFDKLITKQRWQPLLDLARDIIASRDYGFRDITHKPLEAHIKPLSVEEYKKFIDEQKLPNPLTREESERLTQSQTNSLFEQIEKDKPIYKRLKNK